MDPSSITLIIILGIAVYLANELRRIEKRLAGADDGEHDRQADEDVKIVLEPYRRHIETWLAAEPHFTAVAIVDRLRRCTPGAVGDRQLRTLQRFVKSWRAKTAKLLIDGADAVIKIDALASVPAGKEAGRNAPNTDATPR